MNQSSDIDIDAIGPGKYFNEIHTDKARYSPGSVVYLSLNYKLVPNSDLQLLVRYRFLNKIIEEEFLDLGDKDITQWSWETPTKDYQGYLVEVFLRNKNKFIDQINIAVDVSSDWKKFPRYGFVSRFEKLPKSKTDSIMQKLNRHHINGVQFYDWHFKHHMPLSLEENNVTDSWIDIGKRTIYRSTVEQYLQASKRFNMKSMAYNLLYGSWGDGESDGASDSWRLFSDKSLKNPVKIDFDENWSSDIYWMNPGNKNWQEYIFSQTEKVFNALPFDGWHVDQLGNWGKMWTSNKSEIKPDTTFRNFLVNAREYLKRPLVMNAVSQYGQSRIAKSPVEFLYSEVWDPDSTFADLQKIIKRNDYYSGYKLRSVLAAYVNQGISGKKGIANRSAILLADALIFALGGSHLELGEHLLIHPYFPNNNLKMDNELQQNLIKYYDYLVAYQNLLRGGLAGTELSIEATTDIKLSTQPEKGKVFYIVKSDAEHFVINFVNFTSATTMNWRDNKSTQIEPESINNLNVELDFDHKIKNVWGMSPDNRTISPQPLNFNQDQNILTVEVPRLKYWTTILLEYN